MPLLPDFKAPRATSSLLVRKQKASHLELNFGHLLPKQYLKRSNVLATPGFSPGGWTRSIHIPMPSTPRAWSSGVQSRSTTTRRREAFHTLVGPLLFPPQSGNPSGKTAQSCTTIGEPQRHSWWEPTTPDECGGEKTGLGPVQNFTKSCSSFCKLMSKMATPAAILRCAPGPVAWRWPPSGHTHQNSSNVSWCSQPKCLHVEIDIFFYKWHSFDFFFLLQLGHYNDYFKIMW